MSETPGRTPAPAQTPGEVFHSAIRDRRAARGMCVDTRPYGQVPEGDREDLEAAVGAAIARAVNPTAQDYEFVSRLHQAEAERDRLRAELDDIGQIAANAPEDGDSFGLLEELAMRIAAFGVPDEPDDGRHPDGCDCQFCREDEREERAREDRADRDDSVDIGSREDGDHDQCEPTL